jgi:hypothetical protein
MVLTDSEKILLMDTSLDNLKSGGDGILLTEKEYEWMLNYLINDDERYEDCIIFRDNKDKIVGEVGDVM